MARSGYMIELSMTKRTNSRTRFRRFGCRPPPALNRAGPHVNYLIYNLRLLFRSTHTVRVMMIPFFVLPSFK